MSVQQLFLDVLPVASFSSDTLPCNTALDGHRCKVKVRSLKVTSNSSVTAKCCWLLLQGDLAGPD